jgi:hypothetical protein
MWLERVVEVELVDPPPKATQRRKAAAAAIMLGMNPSVGTSLYFQLGDVCPGLQG